MSTTASVLFSLGVPYNSTTTKDRPLFLWLLFAKKTLVCRVLQVPLRKAIVKRLRKLHSDVWPIEERASKRPDRWFGWPERKRFAVVLTHDVEYSSGHEKCYELTRLEKELGFRSSFNFVPKRYEVSAELRHYLTGNGFEVGVHGLYHDGRLFE
jgi:hypothetical protein